MRESDDPQGLFQSGGWKKFLILIAGSLSNFLAGLIVILCLFSHLRRLRYAGVKRVCRWLRLYWPGYADGGGTRSPPLTGRQC